MADRTLAGCTIATRSYLSYARIVAESYLRHHPGSRFYVLVVDRLPAGVEVGGGAEVVEPDALGLPYLGELCFKYGVTELSTALKPTLLAHLLEREESVVYLDPDILVLRSFTELSELLGPAEIVLTPHSLTPLPRDGLRPSEEGMLATGVFNLGFLAVHRSAETQRLLDWWESRLEDGSRVDFANGLFVDQKWADLIPGYFPTARILRDPTYNVAYWNLHERTLERHGSGFAVAGQPVACFHFSGFDPLHPGILSTRIPRRELARTTISEGTPLAELANLYAGLQVEHGYLACREWEYAFARFDNGVKVDELLRRLYSELGHATRVGFGNAFAADGPASFFEWATQSGAQLSPFLQSLRRARPDLAAAFPDAAGRDRDAFLQWARTQGAAELGYDLELVR